MNKWLIIIVSLIFISAGLWIIKSPKSNPLTDSSKSSEAVVYTCPMHPEVKRDKPGKCPICHMDLVKVKKNTVTNQESKSETRGEILATNEELKLIGVQKHKVEKMSLNSKLPISGRFTSPSQIAFQIYERELGEIKIGNKFVGQAAANPEIELQGIVTSIDAYVDPISRTIRVMGTLNTRSNNVRIESSFHGQIIVSIDNVLAIPEDSILHAGNDNLVYIFQEGNALKAKSIKLGIKTRGYYQVLSGLSEGDLITTGANFLLDSEAKIRGPRD